MSDILDNQASASRFDRAEQALKLLHHRIERHADQEVRLGRLYQGCQHGWSAQCDQLRGLVTRLEGHLATWLRRAEPTPMFNVITPPDAE